MFFRAVLAFLALPGIVAGLAPWLLIRSEAAPFRIGLLSSAVLSAGLLVLLACVREFYVAGKGTLAPWNPPKHLVCSGLYRYSRNPMYVGVLLIIAGWALAAGSGRVALYGVGVAIAVHLRVLYYEEPVLARLFGAEWEAYRQRVRRWF